MKDKYVSNKKTRIGIFGGTFDPIHDGHINLAKSAYKKLHLDKIVFVPAYIPPHKKISVNVKAKDRFAMLKIAMECFSGFDISKYEINRKKITYTIETAKFFKKKYGKNTQLFFLIGSDSLKDLPKWRKIGKLQKILKFVVCTRPGYAMKSNMKDIVKIKIPKKDISSTKIRSLLRKNKSAKRFLPEKVYEYIKTRQVYA